MNYLKFTEFHNRSKEYFDQIEKGQSYIITRRGKPIARILPINDTQKVVSGKEQKVPGWKRKIKRIEIKGESLSDTVIRLRREARW